MASMNGGSLQVLETVLKRSSDIFTSITRSAMFLFLAAAIVYRIH